MKKEVLLAAFVDTEIVFDKKPESIIQELRRRGIDVTWGPLLAFAKSSNG